MYEVASFYNFCNASENFLLALSNKPLAGNQARIIERYCKEILAMLQPSNTNVAVASKVQLPCRMPDDSTVDPTNSI